MTDRLPQCPLDVSGEHTCAPGNRCLLYIQMLAEDIDWELPGVNDTYLIMQWLLDNDPWLEESVETLAGYYTNGQMWSDYLDV